MKTQSLILLLAGCLFSLSACQAQAAEPQPAATPGVAAADLEDMQRDLAKAQEEMQRALQEVNVREKIQMTPGVAVTPNMRITTPGSLLIGDHRHANSVLLIPEKAVNAETASQLSEDMRVMAMILNDAVGANPSHNRSLYGRSTGMIIRPGFISFGGQCLPEALWLEGYGVVFTLTVDFPLVPLDGQEAPSQADQEQADQIWQRNRDRLRGVEPPVERGDKDAVTYDPQRVEQLQKRLTDLLRHASNIRNLGANNRIVVVVRGIYAGQPEPEVPTSVMTLQAAKQDIDAFAAEKLDLDEFAQKVAVVIY